MTQLLVFRVVAVRMKSKLESLRTHLVAVWTVFAAIVIGVAANLFAEWIANWVIPAIAVWACTFAFTLVFYPFQKRQEDGIPEFPLWIVYSAAMGIVSIVIFYLKDWLT